LFYEATPYGSWSSPIAVSMLTESAIGLGDVVVDGDDLYWSESRAQEGGRSVIVRRDAHGEIKDMVPEGFSSRSRVHEYGGGSYAVSDGVIVSSNFEDQRVYRIDGGRPVAITPERESLAGDRYADFVFHGDVVICVRERHEEGSEPTNTLVALRLDGSAAAVVIADGHDFFASPRVSPDGETLVWLSWDHPLMPWDGTELWSAALASDGTLSEPELIAGGVTESIFQPEWSPDGALCFVSDRTGWWNLYRITEDGPEALHTMEAEFGVPQWVFGMRRYGFLSDGRVAAIYSEAGLDHLGVIGGGTLTPVRIPYDIFRPSLGIRDDTVCTVAGSTDAPAAVVEIDVDSGDVDVVRESIDMEIDLALVSRPKTIEFPTADGATAHAFYYPPHNPTVSLPTDESPPLVVFSHGGPTSATTPEFKLAIQFWTSRGIAVVDVNYRGSAGYGRRYRDALRGQWGIADLDDCVNAALYLVREGLVDEDRLAIRGGSAGGYTTLCALTFTDVFSAGASYYGVGDLAALATETHKFESRYPDGLVGPYPEAEDVYAERSPINHVDRLDCPVILLQGLDDRVVPPGQAEDIVAALDERGVPHAYLAFEGEGHGFRKAENIERSLEAELNFYSRVFDFDTADDLMPVVIVHEDAL
jgi:dipeptidyl aminopeptidase/acylaminoacyl peptidase